MAKHAESIARAVLRVFRQQQQGGGERFGQWHGRLAEAIAKPLTDAYLAEIGKRITTPRSAIESFASGEDQMSWALETAKAQAAEAAVQINDATTSMLENGREYRDVFSSDRAALIGVDQASKAANACAVRGAQIRKVKLRWVTRGSAACTRICKKLEGKERNPGKMFAKIDGIALFHPPAHPHCLLGETPVNAPDAVLAYTAFYRGTVVRIVTASGDEFTCTAKHQLFGRFGFADAESFVKGDDIGYCPASQQTEVFVGPNNHDLPATIEEIVAAFSESSSMFSASVPVAPEYLHGDGRFCQGEIKIVNPNGFLRGEPNSGGGQLLSEPDFQSTLKTKLFSGDGSSGLKFDGFLLPPTGNLSRSRDLLAVGSGGFGITSRRSIFESADLNAGFDEITSDYASSCVERGSQRKFRFPGKVTATKIVSVRKHSFRGHVFDLQTSRGTYIIGNAIVCSNCFCSLEPVEA